jgi:hypothetical protein
MAEDRRKEPTTPGTGGTNVPARERTVLGVGIHEAPAAPAAPIIAAAPARERTVLGVGQKVAPAVAAPPARERSVQEPPPEGWDLPDAAVPDPPAAPAPPAIRASPALDASIALDLVVKKPDPPKTPAEKPPTEKPLSEVSLAAAGVPRRRGRGWLVVLVLLAVAAGGVYAMRERIPWLRLRAIIGMT